MVDLKDFEEKIGEMTSFYKSLPNRVSDASDMFYAELGKESAEKIVDLVQKYRNDPKNAHLVRLHGHLMTLTRGVEGFRDKVINAQHKEYGKLRYQLFEFLEQKIRW